MDYRKPRLVVLAPAMAAIQSCEKDSIVSDNSGGCGGTAEKTNGSAYEADE